MASTRKIRKKIVHYLKKYDVHIQIVSLVILLIAIPLSLMYFPNETIGTYVLVSITGVLNGLATLADSLMDADEAQEEEHEEVDPDD